LFENYFTITYEVDGIVLASVFYYMPMNRAVCPFRCLPTEEWPGWVDLGGWLQIKMVYPSADGHSSKY